MPNNVGPYLFGSGCLIFAALLILAIPAGINLLNYRDMRRNGEIGYLPWYKRMVFQRPQNKRS